MVFELLADRIVAVVYDQLSVESPTNACQGRLLYMFQGLMTAAVPPEEMPPSEKSTCDEPLDRIVPT